jgi:hypothetical protein
VVAILPRRRLFFRLDIHVLCLVLLHQTAYRRVRVRHAVFRVQLPGLRRVWTIDRHYWILGGIRFC